MGESGSIFGNRWVKVSQYLEMGESVSIFGSKG